MTSLPSQLSSSPNAGKQNDSSARPSGLDLVLQRTENRRGKANNCELRQVSAFLMVRYRISY
jgi:hypothetical protein